MFLAKSSASGKILAEAIDKNCRHLNYAALCTDAMAQVKKTQGRSYTTPRGRPGRTEHREEHVAACLCLDGILLAFGRYATPRGTNWG